MRNNQNYNISIILEHSVSLDIFEIFINWLKTQDDSTQISLGKLEKNTLLNNPSLRFINPEGESIKIDDIRKFNQELAFSNYNNEKRYFIFFNTDLMTLQAQNAALKSIEEPPVNTQIIFLTSSVDKLLPTIISRCTVITLKKSLINKSKLEQISKLYKQILNSKHYELIELANRYKERKEALDLLNDLLSCLHQELNNKSSQYTKHQLTKHLKIILVSLEQLNKNANTKLVVENCLFKMI